MANVFLQILENVGILPKVISPIPPEEKKPSQFQQGVQRVVQSAKDNPWQYVPVANLYQNPTIKKYVNDTAQSVIDTPYAVAKLTPLYDLIQRASGTQPTIQSKSADLISGLMTPASAMWHLNPAAPVSGALFGLLQGERRAIQNQMKGNQVDIMDIINPARTGIAEQPFVGEAITDNPQNAQAINTTFLLLNLLSGAYNAYNTQKAKAKYAEENLLQKGESPQVTELERQRQVLISKLDTATGTTKKQINKAIIDNLKKQEMARTKFMERPEDMEQYNSTIKVGQEPSTGGEITLKPTKTMADETFYDITSKGKKIGNLETLKGYYGPDDITVQYIGVNPANQRQGFSTKALQEVARQNPQAKTISAEPTSQASYKALVKAYGKPIEISNDISTLSEAEALKSLPQNPTFNGKELDATRRVFMRFNNSGGEIGKGGIPNELLPVVDKAKTYKKPTYYVKNASTGTVRYTIGDEAALQQRLKEIDNVANLRARKGDTPAEINLFKKQAYNEIGVYGNKPPQAKVVKVKEPDFEPELEKTVLRKWGETDNPENASFITSDGRYVSWGGGGTRLADHREIAIGELQDYMNKTQNIRVHNSPGSSDVNVDIVYKPTPDQIPALQKMMEGKEKIYADVSGLDGSKKAGGEFGSFAEWLAWVKKHAL